MMYIVYLLYNIFNILIKVYDSIVCRKAKGFAAPAPRSGDGTTVLFRGRFPEKGDQTSV